jgi:hypothetical protein
MPNITLISTIHEEKGECNVSALHKILEKAQPEVIFLEMPEFSYEQVLEDESRANLEAAAVNRYRKTYRPALVPVDIMEASGEMVALSQRLCRELRARSYEYSQLMNAEARNIAQYGFSYLNSKYCVDSWLSIDAVTTMTLEVIGNAQLLNDNKTWEDVNERREREMMRNIQHYCDANPFNKGIFLLGAAHRRPIMEMAESLSGGRSSSIDWNFGDYGQLIDGWRVDAADI